MKYSICITDKNVDALYDIPNPKVVVEPGEESKSRKTKAWVEDQLLAMKADRDSVLFAIGGGVVTDLTGFVASTYLRGIPFVAVPTTLLGMVDAAIGGKTGINTDHGKNLIGTFYPPIKVVTDLSFLKTLPAQEMRSGLAEVIKYAITLEPELLPLLKQETLDFETIVPWCQSLKRGVVTQDMKEQGVRSVLNFGHTLGHALETHSHYTLSHGEAVALGMLSASFISYKRALISSSELDQVLEIITRFNFPLQLPDDKESLITLMKRDKKAKKTIPHFVLLNGLKKPTLPVPVEEQEIIQSLQWIQHVVPHHTLT